MILVSWSCIMIIMMMVSGLSDWTGVRARCGRVRKTCLYYFTETLTNVIRFTVLNAELILLLRSGILP
jgi:hypothetical protein